jgi:hypothetical protein
MGVKVQRQTFIPADNKCIQYYGRVDFSNHLQPAFDWPGIYIKAAFDGTSCKIVLSGTNCFDVFIDGIFSAKILCGTKKQIFTVGSALVNSRHELLIVKRTESCLSPSVFYGLYLDPGKELLKLPAPPARKIEFIGDSYTAGYANEYGSPDCPLSESDSVLMKFTNTHKAFGPITARAFGAQYQVNAYSGKGLVRNFNGIDKGKELLYYYDRTLISPCYRGKCGLKWDFNWKPDVVVICIGINDFQGDPPHADSSVYERELNRFVENLRMRYRGAVFIFCATKIWPNNDLIPNVKKVIECQHSRGFDDIWYYEFKTENSSLHGHPGLDDHKHIAEGLISLITEIQGWIGIDK